MKGLALVEVEMLGKSARPCTILYISALAKLQDKDMHNSRNELTCSIAQNYRTYHDMPRHTTTNRQCLTIYHKGLCLWPCTRAVQPAKSLYLILPIKVPVHAVGLEITVVD